MFLRSSDRVPVGYLEGRGALTACVAAITHCHCCYHGPQPHDSESSSRLQVRVGSCHTHALIPVRPRHAVARPVSCPFTSLALLAVTCGVPSWMGAGEARLASSHTRRLALVGAGGRWGAREGTALYKLVMKAVNRDGQGSGPAWSGIMAGPWNAGRGVGGDLFEEASVYLQCISHKPQRRGEGRRTGPPGM